MGEQIWLATEVSHQHRPPRHVQLGEERFLLNITGLCVFRRDLHAAALFLMKVKVNSEIHGFLAVTCSA